MGKHLCILCVYFVLVAFTYYHTVCEGEPNIWERSLATATITQNVVTFVVVELPKGLKVFCGHKTSHSSHFVVCDPQYMKHEQYSLVVACF